MKKKRRTLKWIDRKINETQLCSLGKRGILDGIHFEVMASCKLGPEGSRLFSAYFKDDFLYVQRIIYAVPIRQAFADFVRWLRNDWNG